MFVGFFPSFWAMNVPPVPRTINVIYFNTILLFILFIGCCYNYFKRQGIQTDISQFNTVLFAVIIFSWLVARSNPIKSAYADLVRGRASGYQKQMEQRFLTLRECDNCVLPPIENIPVTLFPTSIYGGDIQPDSAYWVNQCYASFFRRKSVRIEPEAINKKDIK